MKKLPILLSAIALTSLGLFVTRTQAQTANTTNGTGLKFSPPVIELDLRKGRTYQELIKLENQSGVTETYYPQVWDFTARGEDGGQDFILPEEGDGVYSLARWVNFSKDAIVLAPGEETAVSMSVVVPENAEPGGRYAALLFGTNPKDAVGNAVEVSMLTGPIILGTIEGTANESLKIAEFTIDRDITEYLPVQFMVRIQNDGNVHLKPYGYVEVKNMLGNVTKKLEVNPKLSNVLPDSFRRFDIDWADGTFRIGKYSARLVLSWGENTLPMASSSIVFWVLPWKVIVVVTLAIVILLMVFGLGLSKYNKWIVKRTLARIEAEKKASEKASVTDVANGSK